MIDAGRRVDGERQAHRRRIARVGEAHRRVGERRLAVVVVFVDLVLGVDSCCGGRVEDSGDVCRERRVGEDFVARTPDRQDPRGAASTSSSRTAYLESISFLPSRIRRDPRGAASATGRSVRGRRRRRVSIGPLTVSRSSMRTSVIRCGPALPRRRLSASPKRRPVTPIVPSSCSTTYIGSVAWPKSCSPSTLELDGVVRRGPCSQPILHRLGVLDEADRSGRVDVVDVVAADLDPERLPLLASALDEAVARLWASKPGLALGPAAAVQAGRGGRGSARRRAPAAPALRPARRAAATRRRRTRRTRALSRDGPTRRRVHGRGSS